LEQLEPPILKVFLQRGNFFESVGNGVGQVFQGSKLVFYPPLYGAHLLHEDELFCGVSAGDLVQAGKS
jgi:hypothetical protein